MKFKNQTTPSNILMTIKQALAPSYSVSLELLFASIQNGAVMGWKGRGGTGEGGGKDGRGEGNKCLYSYK